MYANITFSMVDANGDIRITFNPDLGSWSYVGLGCKSSKIKATDPTMNLGWIDDKSANLDPNEKGTILHEFGHALGMMHEHQSPARGGKLTLDEDGESSVIRIPSTHTYPLYHCSCVSVLYQDASLGPEDGEVANPRCLRCQ